MSRLVAVSLLLALAGCGDDDTPRSPDSGAPSDAMVADAMVADTGHDAGPGCDAVANEATYAFESRYEAGVSSVAYDGQVFRQLLIEDLKTFVGRLGSLIDADATGLFDTEEEVLAALDFYYRFDASSEGEEILFSTTPDALQSTWGEVSSGKDLVGKVAGNDSVTDHRAWEAGDFRGWTTALGRVEVTSPETLVQAMFTALAENAAARAAGEQPRGPAGEELPVYVLANGLDLQQLVQKFLVMAVGFSQGTDDYLDDDVENKGLRSANTRDGDNAYSTLEHQWDEAFGYFGAARDYDLYTDDEIAAAGGRPEWQIFHDTNGDCRIDLLSEVNFAGSTNAAKRDRGATTEVDFTRDAFAAFVAGRALIHSVEGALSEDQLMMLRVHRDAAEQAWEKAYAATVVHYVNDVLSHMENFGTEAYSFLDHAKHWAEMKGFALGLQFNPRSPLHESADEGTLFERMHALLGDAPVLATAEEAAISAYRADLLAARALLGDAYDFAEADVAAW